MCKMKNRYTELSTLQNILRFREQLVNYYLGDIVDEEKTEKSVTKSSSNSSNRYVTSMLKIKFFDNFSL